MLSRTTSKISLSIYSILASAIAMADRANIELSGDNLLTGTKATELSSTVNNIFNFGIGVLVVLFVAIGGSKLKDKDFGSALAYFGAAGIVGMAFFVAGNLVNPAP